MAPPNTIVQLTDANAAAWNAFVDNHPDGTIFHLLAWKNAVERAMSQRPHYRLAMRGDAVAGVLPLFEINSVVAGRFLVSVPYAALGGPIGDESAVAALLDEARKLARCLNASSIELRTRRAVDPSLPCKSRHAYFEKRLPDCAAEIDEFLPRKARAAARKAASSERLTSDIDPDGLTTVWRLYARSMRRLGSPNYPLRLFQALRDELADRFWVQLVRDGANPVAGLIGFAYKNAMMPYFAGLDERVELYGLNHYLYRESMRRAIELGLTHYDFGRSRVDNPGPYNFKRHCGFEPTPLEYQTFVVDGHAAPDLSPTSPRWTLARDLWRRMPLVLTRPLGAWIAKSIPG